MFREAKELVIAAQQRFLQEANRTSIDLYWELGKLLAETAHPDLFQIARDVRWRTNS